MASQDRSIPTEDDYVYQPLQSDRAFRLMRLLPGNDGEELRIQLYDTLLDLKPVYASISYVWGPEDPPAYVFCEDKKIRITENLEMALHQFRRTAFGPLPNDFTQRKSWDVDNPALGTQVLELEDFALTNGVEPPYLWTDSICINQSDVDERNKQVRAMGKIYEGCRRVLIWLGPEAGESTLAFSTMKEMAAKHMALDADARRDPEKIPRLPPPGSPEDQALLQLLSRPWFARGWTYQENALAPNALLFCGSEWMSRRQFVHFSASFTPTMAVFPSLERGSVTMLMAGLGLQIERSAARETRISPLCTAQCRC